MIFPDAILFDWDNTLVDTTRGTHQAINLVLSAFGQGQLSFDTFLEQPPVGIKSYFRTIFEAHQQEEAEKLFREHQLRFAISPFTHIYPMLQWLRNVDRPMAVVSNKEGSQLRKEITKLGWQDYFFCAIGSQDTAEDKPSAVPLLHALDHKRIDPGKSVWFVGDSHLDVHCAQAAGCTPVFIGHPSKINDASVTCVPHQQALLALLQESYYHHCKKSGKNNSAYFKGDKV